MESENKCCICGKESCMEREETGHKYCAKCVFDSIQNGEGLPD